MDVVKGGVNEAASAIQNLLTPTDTQEPESQPVEVESTVEEVSATEVEPTEAEAPAQTQEAQTYTVKVDGEEQAVTLDELLKGYSRTSYFHKKLSEIDLIRKEVESEKQSIVQERDHLAQLLPQLKAELEKGDVEPNWEQLFNEDPIEFVRQEALWRQKKEKKQLLLQEQARLLHQQQTDHQRMVQKRIADEGERLLHAIPEWKNSEVAAKEKAEILEYGVSLGYSPEEMAQVYDHRAVILMRKAMAFDNAQTKVKDLKANGPKVKSAAPGSVSAPKNTEFQKLQKSFVAKPTVKNAAAAIERLISNR